VIYVDWVVMWPMCMSREIFLVGHTNINIEDKAGSSGTD
jgi:hypothetical protein